MTTNSESQPNFPHASDHTIDRENSAGGGAKYKLMSPATLPISKSACINIPPGLSPSSFLDSPVLVSNVKAETSPTTGSFTKPQAVHDSLGSQSYPTSISSNCFELSMQAKLNIVSADGNQQSVQVHGSFHSPSLASSSSTQYKSVVSSNELCLSATGNIITEGACVHTEADIDGMIQRGTVNNGLQASHPDLKEGTVSPKSADDGYNWRKYGQKVVKCSEFPRSYYKCTHPNCEVKKLFERSRDGQITEVIYKGTHDHPRPQLNRRYSSGAISVPEERSDKVASLPGQDDRSACAFGEGPHVVERNGILSSVITKDNGAECGENDDDPFSKRRKMESGDFVFTPVVKPIREPRVVVQTLSEVDILDDGYRWRKYGQKVVRGNPNPRSYYKCTNAGCMVRKHVERASHDPKAVITTYEGKHNHDVPAARNSSHDTAGPSAISGPLRILRDKNDTVSLDLGVGLKSSAETTIPDHQTTQHSRFVIANSVNPYYRALHGGFKQYGTRPNPMESLSVQVLPLNHPSYPCPQSVGRLLTGP